MFSSSVLHSCRGMTGQVGTGFVKAFLELLKALKREGGVKWESVENSGTPCARTPLLSVPRKVRAKRNLIEHNESPHSLHHTHLLCSFYSDPGPWGQKKEERT